jgi:MSHA biogenesis protein MshO
MLGSNPASSDQSIGIGDVIVVYNLGPGINDAYSSINTSSVTAVGSSVVVAPGTGSETPITINGKQFPLPSGGNRFHVVPSAEQVVGYVCMADSTLRRYVMTLPYPTMTTCPSSPPAASILALNAACAFDYSGSDLQRNALVSMRLQLTDTGSGESVNLYHEVHVDNTP